MAVAVFDNEALGVEVGNVAVVLCCLPLAVGERELVGEEVGEVDGTPDFVFPHEWEDVAELFD